MRWAVAMLVARIGERGSNWRLLSRQAVQISICETWGGRNEKSRQGLTAKVGAPAGWADNSRGPRATLGKEFECYFLKPERMATMRGEA